MESDCAEVEEFSLRLLLLPPSLLPLSLVGWNGLLIHIFEEAPPHIPGRAPGVTREHYCITYGGWVTQILPQ